MVRFNIKNGTVVIDVNSLGINSFKAIYDYDKSKNKAKAARMLYFVYLISDLRQDNPLRSVPFNEKEGEARLECFGGINKRLDPLGEKLLDAAILDYEKFSDSSEERMLEEYDKKIDEQREIMSKLEGLTIQGSDAKLESNFKDLLVGSMENHGIEKKVIEEVISDMESTQVGKVKINEDYNSILDGILKNLAKFYSGKETLKKAILDGNSGKIRGGKTRSLIESGTFTRVKSDFDNK